MQACLTDKILKTLFIVCPGCDRVVVEFTTIYTIGVYYH
jgi:hypothetical protein